MKSVRPITYTNWQASDRVIRLVQHITVLQSIIVMPWNQVLSVALKLRKQDMQQLPFIHHDGKVPDPKK